MSERTAPSVAPATNPAFLTGAQGGWPLAALAELGYRGLEITPASLEESDAWRSQASDAGMHVAAVNGLPELTPYLTGSLSDNVAWRRNDTVARMLQTLGRMAELEVSFLVVAPSRLAEIYQTPEEARALLVASLLELSSAAADQISILVMGAPFRLFGTAAEIAAIVDDVGRANVAAALDTGHSLLVGESPDVAASTLGTRLR